MVFLTLTDFQGNDHAAVYSPSPEPAETLLQAMEQAEYLVADWVDPAGFPGLQALSGLGSRLLIPEQWQRELPNAGLLVSSAMSGGDLHQRFQELAQQRSCWLQLQPMCMIFSLPCPNGQGTPASELPKTEGFYSEALGCRYMHQPGQITLFDTEETLEKKITLAQESGFLGVIYPAKG